MVIARAEAVDIERLSRAIAPMVDRGLKIKAQEIREKFGLSEPATGDEVLEPATRPDPAENAGEQDQEPSAGNLKGVSAVLKGGAVRSRPEVALNADGASAALPAADPVGLVVGALSDRLERDASASIEGMIDQVEAMLERASSLEEFREMVLNGLGEIDSGALAEVMARAMLAAWGAGRVAVAVEEEEEAVG